mmetsp:Transcript_70223/g.146982  ORF Transcript_70223/g.146982 Transcript_70223/m.146982 type:complete len:360 (+) Transcript_70223:982-2061(+)
MAASIDDVEGGDRHHVLVRGSAREGGDVLVEGDLHGGGTGTADGHGHGQDGVGSQLRLGPAPVVHGTVQDLHHLLVQGSLLRHVHAQQGRGDDLIHVLHGLQNALAQQAALVAISQFQGLVDASGGATGHGSPEHVLLGDEVHLHSGIASGVEDLAGLDALDGGRGGDHPIHLGHVAGQVHQSVGVAPLVVVPGHQLQELVVQGDAGTLVEDGGEGASGEVGGDHLLVGEAQDAVHGALASLLDGSADVLHGGALLHSAGQIHHRDVRSGHSEGHARELAIQSGNDLAHGLGSSSGGRNDVLGSASASSPVLASSRRSVNGQLSGSHSVHSGHQTFQQAEFLLNHLGKRSQAIGRARSI